MASNVRAFFSYFYQFIKSSKKRNVKELSSIVQSESQDHMIRDLHSLVAKKRWTKMSNLLFEDANKIIDLVCQEIRYFFLQVLSAIYFPCLLQQKV